MLPCLVFEAMGTGIRLVCEAALEPCGNEWRGREGRQGEGVISTGVLEEETAHHAPKKSHSTTCRESSGASHHRC